MICIHWFPFGSIMRALSERTRQRSDLLIIRTPEWVVTKEKPWDTIKWGKGPYKWVEMRQEFYPIQAICLKLPYLCKGSVLTFHHIGSCQIESAKNGENRTSSKLQQCGPRWQSPQPFRTEVYFQHCLSFLKALAFCFPLDTPHGGMGVRECIGGSGEEKKSSLLLGSWQTALTCPLRLMFGYLNSWFPINSTPLSLIYQKPG